MHLKANNIKKKSGTILSHSVIWLLTFRNSNYPFMYGLLEVSDVISLFWNRQFTSGVKEGVVELGSEIYNLLEGKRKGLGMQL